MAFYTCKVKDVSKIKVDNKEVINFRWASLKDLETDKIILRNPVLKPILIRALEKPACSLEVFEEIEVKI